MNTTDIVEKVKKEFETLTSGIPLSDYVDVCAELADEFSVRADAGQADLDRENED